MADKTSSVLDDSPVERENEFSSVEGELGDPLKKRTKVSLQETGAADQEKESTTLPTIMTLVTQDIQLGTGSEATMAESKESEKISQTPSTQSYGLNTGPSADSENEKPKIDSRGLSSATVSSQTQEKKYLDRDNKCSICGKNDCPWKTCSASVPSKLLIRNFKSPVKTKLSKVNVKKLKGINTASKSCVHSRSTTNERIADHSPFHIFRLKAELFRAVENGDLARVQELIQYTGAAVRRSKTSCTLLHAAASHNQADVVMFLLKLISPNVTNKEGQTPAHVAAEKGHTQVLKLLVRDPDFDADKRDNRQNSVKSLLGSHLLKAVLEGNEGEAERPVVAGAEADVGTGAWSDDPSPDGQSPEEGFDSCKVC
nr:receptor-interacting serine/threonine-protein kinase 4-like [Penaeus vannamei]